MTEPPLSNSLMGFKRTLIQYLFVQCYVRRTSLFICERSERVYPAPSLPPSRSLSPLTNSTNKKCNKQSKRQGPALSDPSAMSKVVSAFRFRFWLPPRAAPAPPSPQRDLSSSSSFFFFSFFFLRRGAAGCRPGVRRRRGIAGAPRCSREQPAFVRRDPSWTRALPNGVGLRRRRGGEARARPTALPSSPYSYTFEKSRFDCESVRFVPPEKCDGRNAPKHTHTQKSSKCP
jgi:hypothetical protein